MTWRGPALGEEQRDVAAMLDSLAADRDVVLDDDDAVAAAVKAELVELGIWTVGADESVGGGGADHATSILAFERLGRAWPALGWASVQTHAALDVLAQAAPANIVASLVDGSAAVAVVDAAAPHVHLTAGEPPRIDRIDPGPGKAHVVVLQDAAVVLWPADQGQTTPLRRTGLGGASTSSVVLAGEPQVVLGIDPDRARRRLALGAAAVAGGLMGAAADDAAKYAAERQQFGGPLTAIPSVRQSLLRQATATATSLRAAISGDDDTIAAWAVLSQATQAAVEVAADALQSHGGYGYLTEYPAERRLRDALSLRAATSAQSLASAVGQALVASC